MLKLVISKLDNIKVTTKLIILYLTCVFLPITILLSIFYVSMAKDLQQKQLDNVNASVNKIKYQIYKLIEISKTTSDNILLNNDINELISYGHSDLLSEKYSNRRMLDSIIKLYTTSNIDISNIYIYTSTPSLFFGGNFFYLDENIKSEKWYDAFVTSNKIIIQPYTVNDKTYVSLIRYMNYFDNSSRNLLKIDIDPSSIERILKDEFDKSSGVDIYIVDKMNNIIATNNYSNSINISKATKDVLQNKNEFSTNSLLNDWSIVTNISMESFSKESEKLKIFFIILMCLSLIVTTFIIYLITHSITYRLKILTNKMKKAQNNKLDFIGITAGKDEIGQTISQFNNMIITIQNLIGEVYEAGFQKNMLMLEKSNSELHALQDAWD